jgi:hypothetical protein
MIIADQRLRVANMSDTLNTNPYYFLQKRFKRLYFKFQPNRYYWCAPSSLFLCLRAPWWLVHATDMVFLDVMWSDCCCCDVPGPWSS